MNAKLYASLQYDYLIRNNLVYRFINNILDIPNEKFGMSASSLKTLSFKKYLEKYNIPNAFIWGETKEGAYFWTDHADKFDKKVRNYEIENSL